MPEVKDLLRNNYAKFSRPVWRTHSCVPCRDFRFADPFRASRHVLPRGKPSVGTSARPRGHPGTHGCVRHAGMARLFRDRP
jgi:hypothetical protein